MNPSLTEAPKKEQEGSFFPRLFNKVRTVFTDTADKVDKHFVQTAHISPAAPAVAQTEKTLSRRELLKHAAKAGVIILGSHDISLPRIAWNYLTKDMTAVFAEVSKNPYLGIAAEVFQNSLELFFSKELSETELQNYQQLQLQPLSLANPVRPQPGEPIDATQHVRNFVEVLDGSSPQINYEYISEKYAQEIQDNYNKNEGKYTEKQMIEVQTQFALNDLFDTGKIAYGIRNDDGTVRAILTEYTAVQEKQTPGYFFGDIHVTDGKVVRAGGMQGIYKSDDNQEIVDQVGVQNGTVRVYTHQTKLSLPSELAELNRKQRKQVFEKLNIPHQETEGSWVDQDWVLLLDKRDAEVRNIFGLDMQ